VVYNVCLCGLCAGVLCFCLLCFPAECLCTQPGSTISDIGLCIIATSTTIPFHLSLSSYHNFVDELWKFDTIHSVHYSLYNSSINVYLLVNIIDCINYEAENAFR
jgi:hypothetical protein